MEWGQMRKLGNNDIIQMIECFNVYKNDIRLMIINMVNTDKRNNIWKGKG